MKFKFFSALFLLTSILSAQSIEIEWSKYFGGVDGEARSIIKTVDGGMMVAGEARIEHPEAVGFSGGADAFLVKLDVEGNREWSHCYGDEGFDILYKIIQTADLGYAFVGRARNGSDDWDAWIVKVDVNGVFQWEQKYGGTLDEYAYDVIELANGHIIVGGYSRSNNGDIPANYGYADYILMRLNGTDGSVINIRNIGGESNDRAYGLVASPGGGYVIAGESQSENYDVDCHSSSICESSFWMAKINASESIVWQQCVGSVNAGTNYFNTAYDIQTTSDNGYIIVGSGRDGWAGYTYGDRDVWVVKLDSNGNVVMREFYGGSDNDYGYAIQQTSDGGYIIVGKTASDDYDVEYDNPELNFDQGWVFKIGGNGVLQWQKVIGSSGIDTFNDIIELNENEYVLAGKPGHSNNDCVDSEGREFWVLKLNIEDLGVSDNNFNKIKIYPNPSSQIINISSVESIEQITIYNMLGVQVKTINEEAIKNVDVSELSNGTYFMEIRSLDNSIVRKVIIDN